MKHALNRSAAKNLGKTLMGAILFCATLSAPAKANAVVTDVGACADYFVMAAPSGYALIQWNAGQALSKGDAITGDINSVGLRDTVLLRGGAVRIQVEDFGMNYAKATQLLRTRCGVVAPALP